MTSKHRQRVIEDLLLAHLDRVIEHLDERLAVMAMSERARKLSTKDIIYVRFLLDIVSDLFDRPVQKNDKQRDCDV